MGIQIKKIILLVVFIPLILSIGLAPALPNVDAAPQSRDKNTQCKTGHELVFRTVADQYVCVSNATADKWVDWGMAERVFSGKTIDDLEEEATNDVPVTDSKIDYDKEKKLKAYADGGKDPLTVTPVIGTPTKQYDPYPMTPGAEELDDNEMRITLCGTGMPYPTYSQAAACVLVELGNGDMFLFDIGSSSISRINGVGIPLVNLDKVFVGHLHTDHVGDLGILLAQGFLSRPAAIELYGPSGPDHEMGTAYFAQKIQEAYKWDFESRRGVVPTSGMVINVHEFDYGRTQVVYEENGVKITAFPAIHSIDGSVSYRLDWKDIAFVYSSDTHPNEFLVENAQNADLLIHESFATADTLHEKLGFSKENAVAISEGVHTPPSGTGIVFGLTNPKIGGMYHQLIDDDVVEETFTSLREAYDGPTVFLQDLTVFNITPDYIVVRQAVPNLNPFPVQDPSIADAPLDTSQYKISEWLEDRVIDWKGLLAEKQGTN